VLPKGALAGAGIGCHTMALVFVLSSALAETV
jgi:hypothetical protein